MPAPSVVLISEGFGTGDASKTYPIPVPSQIPFTDGAASFVDGFPPLTRTALGAGGVPPSGEDMNGILFMLSAHMALINSGQPYRFSSAQATAIAGYDKGALLLNTAGDGLWLSQVNPNSADPNAGSANWLPLPVPNLAQISLTTGTITLTAAQAACPVLEFIGTLTGNVTVNVPVNTNGGQQWIAASNATHAGHTITIQAVGGSLGIVIPAGGYSQAQGLFTNGVDLYSNNVSTAGLAPLNNPTFTGTPAAPTAPATNNNTQIATTAFTQAAIALAIAGLAPLASPTFTGVPTAPTPAPGDNTVKLATTAFVQAAAGSTVNKALTGHLTLANGLIIQWGVHAVSPSTTTTVPFDISFPTACAVVIPTQFGTNGVEWTVQSKAVGSFVVNQGSSGGANQVLYIAIGY